MATVGFTLEFIEGVDACAAANVYTACHLSIVEESKTVQTEVKIVLESATGQSVPELLERCEGEGVDGEEDSAFKFLTALKAMPNVVRVDVS
jgi:hypothetical protein